VLDVLERDSAATEADVELKVITPLLTGRNYLGIPLTAIKGKEYLAPTTLDKKAGKTGGYFPDFSVWELALPVLIVEAKGPEVPVNVGYREASLYARHLNAQFKHGVNPCKFIVACNGHELSYGYWDSNAARAVQVADLRVGSRELEALRDFCNYGLLQAHAARSLAQVRLERATEPSSLAGGQALLTSPKPFNTFAAELTPLLRRYFTSTTQNNDPEIFEKAYVGSDNITEYDRVLESLLKDRISSRRIVSEELSPSRGSEPKLTKAIGSFKSTRADRSTEGELQLITGGVGTGKSLFARRYKELLQPPEQSKWTHWAFIDFNTAPDPIVSAENWLCQKFVDSFFKENPGFDPYGGDNLSRIFSQDLQRRKGIYDETRKKISDVEAEKLRIDDLQKWQADPQRLAFGVCRHFSMERREVIVVVMDNVDRLSLQNQLTAFGLSLWFLDQSKAFVVLQMRDETYERFKDKPPLDTFRTGVVFHIAPPRFLDVVKRRLELSLDYLAQHTPQTLEYSLSNGMRIRYPNTMLGEFLKSIYLELFDRKQNISRVLQGLAGRDIRKALDMFVSILNSGHLTEEQITSTAKGGAISIPEYRVLKILMRTEYRFFHDKSGFISNVFHSEPEWVQPNNFLVADILFWLCDNRKLKGEIGLEGFFTVERIASELQRRGFVRNDVGDACSWLLTRGLVESDHMNQSEVDFGDCIKVTASGFIHIRILTERFEYLYGVLTVTPIFEKRVAENLAEYLKRENQQGYQGAYQQVRAIEEFLQYLQGQHRKLKEAFMEFGGPRTGASFVIRQIESALRYFKNPTVRTNEPNLLDE
jgi:hypothetical protein